MCGTQEVLELGLWPHPVHTIMETECLGWSYCKHWASLVRDNQQQEIVGQSTRADVHPQLRRRIDGFKLGPIGRVILQFAHELA